MRNVLPPSDTPESVNLLNALLIDLFRSNPPGHIGPEKLGRYIEGFLSLGIDMREFYAYTRAKKSKGFR